MESILVTGCNRGLGLGIIKHLLKENPTLSTVIATCRDKSKATELQQIAHENSNVHILEVDVLKTDTFDKFAEQVESIVKDNGLNVLFNNAGVAPKSTRINFVKEAQMIDTFRVNTVAPLLMSKALLPLLKRASTRNRDKPLGIGKAAIINMSSILASIKANTDGGLYPYRCSKVAVNMVTASLAVDLKRDGILAVALHPGWVRTEMGGSSAPLDVDTSTSSIVKLLPNLSAEHCGKFLSWEGKLLDF